MCQKQSVTQVTNSSINYRQEDIERALKCLDGLDHWNAPDVRREAIRDFANWFQKMPDDFQACARELLDAKYAGRVA